MTPTPSLANKRIVLGITGGIAAYKTPDLVRKLTELGAEVRVVMSRGAEQFVAPLALQAVSGHHVNGYLMTAESESGMGHIDLARWADAVLIAPATAHFVASLRQGSGHDLLTTICLATTAKIVLAPAMNQQMWQNSVTQENITTLKSKGIELLGPASGEQACGEVGPGRMLQPEEIAPLLAETFHSGSLIGKNVLLTAGPTWEAIDPVRGITNHSSGKMGYALAQAAQEAGASVTLVTGPTNITKPDRVDIVNVVSALEMRDAVIDRTTNTDVFIAVAAVADYRPFDSVNEKIKKDSDDLTLKMIKNPDILSEVAALKDRPYCVGFAAETNNVIDYARSKLEKKKLDMIIANHVGGSEVGFGSDDNKIIMIMKGQIEEPPQASKTQLARLIIESISKQITP